MGNLAGKLKSVLTTFYETWRTFLKALVKINCSRWERQIVFRIIARGERDIAIGQNSVPKTNRMTGFIASQQMEGAGDGITRWRPSGYGILGKLT